MKRPDIGLSGLGIGIFLWVFIFHGSYFDKFRLHLSSSQQVKTPLQFTSEREKLFYSQKMDINRATARDLILVPGIGSSYAARILTYRIEQGSFTQLEEIKKIKGIGEKRFRNIKSYFKI